MKIRINEEDRKLLSDFMKVNYSLEVGYDDLMPITRVINDMPKGYQFAIFKTYVSCTVEAGGKFYKDFSFSHAEYITPEQNDLQAILNLILKFILWFNAFKGSSLVDA